MYNVKTNKKKDSKNGYEFWIPYNMLLQYYLIILTSLLLLMFSSLFFVA